MSDHRATVTWRRTTSDFALETYGRDHLVTFGGGARLEMSSAPEYRGDASKPNPEEQLVAALASCHMLTFLAICARRGVVVDAYDDEADGVLAKNQDGRLAVTRVKLRPRVTFAPDAAVDAAKVKELHDAAHRGCFIANSVKTTVTVEPR